MTRQQLGEDIVLGLITTGSGRRPDYETFHRAALASLGVPGVRIEFRNALDGLDDAQIAALAPAEREPRIHAFVRRDSESSALGRGWGERWISRPAYLDRVSVCVSQLEDDGASAIIVCVAEEIPGQALASSSPVILPWLAVSSLVAGVAATSDERLRVGLFASSDAQREQQAETWARIGASGSVAVHAEALDGDPVGAARRMAEWRPDIAVFWAYGAGLGTSMISEVEAILDVPLVLPHVATVLAVRQLLAPTAMTRIQETSGFGEGEEA